MLKIDKLYVENIEKATKLSALYPSLQLAIEVEHSTIPPYLTALYSLKPNTEEDTANILQSIVVEEMLHMTIASNILNALGGQPKINSPKFVPEYPTALPMHIAGELVVNLAPYSKNLVANTFMLIEEPDDPLILKEEVGEIDEPYKTIGDFYRALQNKIKLLAPDKLPGDPTRQVVSNFYSSQELFPILTKEDAIRGIDIIVSQGEGSSTSPIDVDGDPAHYYRFEQLVAEHFLVKDPSAPHGYSYTGTPIVLNPANVYPMFPNCKAFMLPVGSEERRMMDNFNLSYRALLNALNTTFNGQPDFLSNAIGCMIDLRLQALKLAATPFPSDTSYTIAPSFEFITN